MKHLILNMDMYGKRRKVHIGIILIVVCMITPFTNWLIPFILKSKLRSVYV